MTKNQSKKALFFFWNLNEGLPSSTRSLQPSRVNFSQILNFFVFAFSLGSTDPMKSRSKVDPESTRLPQNWEKNAHLFLPYPWAVWPAQWPSSSCPPPAPSLCPSPMSPARRRYFASVFRIRIGIDLALCPSTSTFLFLMWKGLTYDDLFKDFWEMMDGCCCDNLTHNPYLLHIKFR